MKDKLIAKTKIIEILTNHNYFPGKQILNAIAEEILLSLEEKEESMIITTKQRVYEIYDKPFNGHPSREDDAKNKDAIFFLAEQIDILHKIRIKKG